MGAPQSFCFVNGGLELELEEAGPTPSFTDDRAQLER